ncbi:hypothetical protein [Cellulomonas sp. C5510]|uniref:hypothetical protein n=1 Tax=Cellulomonas sp. C5510 TaxID=2871170 RepID=UPI001C974BB6|nr:hypothetical protein [Cellulomonas sp. C5510]QZN84573.1 hypothetical protein K5O09_12030 [Cellulomonas sp. C5510]
MGAYAWGIGLALLAAVGVIVAANAAEGGRTGLRTFWQDLRGGLRRDAEDQPAEAADAEPVDVPFAQLFAEASQPDDGYLQLDELADMLERTGERAGRLLPGRAGARGHDRDAARPVPSVPADRPAAPRQHDRHPRIPRPVHVPTAARRSGHAPAGVAADERPPTVPPRPRDGTDG